jgi:phosphoribosylformimino-5-aminoimidazole carboxamide ribonucleotide (ProFAR) isomerase
MKCFEEVSKAGKYSRTGVLHTRVGDVTTPTFMPDGTRGAVKSLTPELVASTGVQVVLANTYHLHMAPGEDVISTLGGAKSGKPEHFNLIAEIRKNVSMKIELGGGIRDIQTVEKYFAIGIDYLILGSMLLKNKTLAIELLKKYGEKIIVGIDGKDGFVKTEGWLENSNTPILDLLIEMQKAGAKQAIVTDISRDGMLTGPNFELYKTLGEKTKLQIIASGGVSSLDDLKKICFVIPYFGKWPNCFKFFLKSCEFNQTINWLFSSKER